MTLNQSSWLKCHPRFEAFPRYINPECTRLQSSDQFLQASNLNSSDLEEATYIPKAFRAVLSKCNGDFEQDPGTGIAWVQQSIPPDHEIFSAQPAPLPALLDIPLVFHKLPTNPTGSDDFMDNEKITRLNIDPDTGLAPPQWQSGVGTVLVARTDGKHLIYPHIEAILAYCEKISEIFGNGDGAPRHMYNRKSFEEFWFEYRARTADNWSYMWRNVGSPYEAWLSNSDRGHIFRARAEAAKAST